MQPLPFDVIEAMPQCFGRSFHFKDMMASFLITAGVDKTMVNKYRDEAKFVWARHVLTDLGQTEEGRLVQRKILTELCKLKNLPDPNVTNRDSGLSALRELKEMALKKDLVSREKIQTEAAKANVAEEKARVARDRSKKLETLKEKFNSAFFNPDRQAAGYSLEDLLAELFALFEIEYTKSYRTSTQQIDGHFNFQSFDYLVEARWRKDYPADSEIGGFKSKVDSKFESTRGLFISIVGFRKEVTDQYSGRGANIIFVDGEDLTFLLEGRIDLKDALKFKVEKAAQIGQAFVPLREFL